MIAVGKFNHSAAILVHPPDGPIWQASCAACICRLTEMSAALSNSLQHPFAMCNTHMIRMHGPGLQALSCLSTDNARLLRGDSCISTSA